MRVLRQTLSRVPTEDAKSLFRRKRELARRTRTSSQKLSDQDEQLILEFVSTVILGGGFVERLFSSETTTPAVLADLETRVEDFFRQTT